MSEKYPRIYHVPFSPGTTSDDRLLASVDHLYNKDLVITEKCDGGNACLDPTGVYARTHGSTANHPSFDHLKATWSTVKSDIPEGWAIYGENMMAKHSIAYTSLPALFLVFGVLTDTKEWLSWADVKIVAESLNLKTVPELWAGRITSQEGLQQIVESLLAEGSQCGGEAIEGIVVRAAGRFSGFDTSIAKYVRKGHVKTSEHWMLQAIVPNKLR